MIQVKEFPTQTFESKQDLFKALRENKDDIIAKKRMMTKEADAAIYTTVSNSKGEVIKSPSDISEDVRKIRVKAVINTTNILDSHSDVHIDGLWKKSLNERKNLYLLQEHKMTFENIISDNVKAKAVKKTFKDLGYDFDGNTEALIFDAEIDKDRNPYMFEQYTKGYVRNHSVGMRYVKLALAIDSNSEHDKEEKKVWDKYIDTIANKEEAKDQGYFFAVTEAKILEGSAVPVGSNWATPTESVEAVKYTSDPEAAYALQSKQKQFYNNLM